MADRLPPIVRANFAERLRLTRINRGYKTARGLAKKLGIDENRYTRYERAEVEPDLTLLSRICTTLGVSANELLEFAAPPMKERWPAPVTAGTAAVQGGFHEDGSPARELADTPQIREGILRRDAIAWQLAGRVAAIDGFGGSAGLAPGDAMAVMHHTSKLFTELQCEPFAFISRVVSDEAVNKRPASEKDLIKDLIDQLIASISDRVLSDAD